MGRPLFSKAYAPPVVRVQPEPTHPVYAKWTPIDSFDPDADDWFEGDNAVYEAFLPPDLNAAREDGSAMNASVESLQSEATSVSTTESGRASPLFMASDDAAPAPAAVEPEDVLMAAPADDHDVRAAVAETESLVRPTPHTPLSSDPAALFLEVDDAESETDEPEPEPVRATASAARPIPIPAPRTHTRPMPIPLVPSTPPAQLALPQITPSATPRLYTWRRPSVSISTSPIAGPLTNPSARRSLAHIAPAGAALRA